MKEGDNVYFFHKRNIFGIGTLKNINFDCKFKNFPDAFNPIDYNSNDISDYNILPIEEFKLNKNKIIKNTNRCICTFVPNPNFFKLGIDMDDVLSSNPYSFRMLRAFEKLSFVKIDDQENKALKDIILKRNEEYINSNNSDYIYTFDNAIHNNISNNIDSRYKIENIDIEIKKDKASIDAINQVMKYVDWISNEYSFGDYSMIEAFIVAYDFSDDSNNNMIFTEIPIV